MKDKLIFDINKYIGHLNDIGLFVTVHGKGISGLLEHNIHINPYCTLVKTNDNAWQKCIRCQQRVFGEYKRESFFGMCYAGMEEYVYFVNDKLFISVSGYGIDEEKAYERICRISHEFYLEKYELLRIYKHSLRHEKEDEAFLNTLIHPLCHMLRLLQMLIPDILENEIRSKTFDLLLSFVQYNFMKDITISDIAQACACSESCVCHVFKECTGKPIKKYITELRINQAKKLLRTSELSIGMVAQMCGFANINHFPTAFKKHTGMNPTEYRHKPHGSHADSGK